MIPSEEVEQFMLAVDRMKQGERGLYKPLSSKFKKLALVSRLVFSMKDSGDEEATDEKEVKEERNGNLGEEKVDEGNKKDELDSTLSFCAMDMAKTFEY